MPELGTSGSVGTAGEQSPAVTRPIKFTDGSSGIVDFTDIIEKYPTARPLADPSEFQRFYLDEWPTLAWPCGFDFSPEGLYERATGRRAVWANTDTKEENASL